MIATMQMPIQLSLQSSVLDYGYRDNKVQTGFGNIATTLKTIYRNADAHYSMPVTRITQQQRFELLALTWQRDTALSSFSFDISSHPAYQQIIGMGQAALPLIFEKMQQNQEHWFPALYAITGINPVLKENRGNITAMTQDWLNWGLNHGLVNA